ncbi:hypothetical protein [Brevibacillus formosus]|uniref:hypothetical protein n=1 Tax=Brevibacillus formosus TaxID=54913 RepID=UPI001476D5BC|nr:hypothetical protein [Brevibacillus formosus]
MKNNILALTFLGLGEKTNSAPTHKKRSNAKKTLNISNNVKYLLYMDNYTGYSAWRNAGHNQFEKATNPCGRWLKSLSGTLW